MTSIDDLISSFEQEDIETLVEKTILLKIIIYNKTSRMEDIIISSEYLNQIIYGAQMVFDTINANNEQIKKLAEVISERLAKIINIYNNKYGSISSYHIKDIQELISFV